MITSVFDASSHAREIERLLETARQIARVERRHEVVEALLRGGNLRGMGPSLATRRGRHSAPGAGHPSSIPMTRRSIMPVKPARNRLWRTFRAERPQRPRECGSLLRRTRRRGATKAGPSSETAAIQQWMTDAKQKYQQPSRAAGFRRAGGQDGRARQGSRGTSRTVPVTLETHLRAGRREDRVARDSLAATV